MPEIPVKEVRLPELHLPEISRDEILKTVSEVRRPDFDLPDIERPKFEMPDIAMPRLPSRIGSWRMPEIDIPAVDIANLIASAVAAIGIIRPRRRPRFIRYRWGIVAGLAVGAGAAALLVWRRQAARQQVEDAARGEGLETEGDAAATGDATAGDAATTRVSLEGTTALDETGAIGASNGSDSGDGDMAATGDLAALGETSGSDDPEESPGALDATEMTDLVSEPAPASEATGDAPADGFEDSSRGSAG